MNWPTEYTGYLLFLGILPLVYAVFQVFKNGPRELVSLRFTTILFVWLGYHFSPLASYATGVRWDYYLLVPKYIDDGLLFSTLVLFAFILGYSFSNRVPNYANHLHRMSYSLPYVKPKWLLIMAFISVAAFTIEVGGIEEAWRSSVARGAGQFHGRDFAHKILHLVGLISQVISVILAGMAAITIVNVKQTSAARKVAWLCLLIACLKGIFLFSRGAGAPFVVLAFMALRYRGKRGVAPALIALVVAFFLGYVGLHQRGFSNPGIGNFLEAAATTMGLSDASNPMASMMDNSVNPLDAMPAWTRKVDSGGGVANFSYWLEFLLNMNPIPSEILPPSRIGPDLAQVMGTEGIVGLTTPALGENFYVFGYVGAIFGIILGMLFGWVEKQAILHPSIWAEIMLILCFVSVPISLHSTVRAFTRPVEYGLVLFYFMRRRNLPRNLPTKDVHLDGGSGMNR